MLLLLLLVTYWYKHTAMYIIHVQIDTVYIVWDYVLHFSTVCIFFFSFFIFYIGKIFNDNWILLKKWLHEKKICRLSFQILILYSLKKKFLFFFLPKTDLQGLLNIVKNDFIKNRANQVLLGSNIRLRLTNYSRKMSFTKGHIFFYFTLNGEPLQLNKSILNYMHREEDLSNE